MAMGWCPVCDRLVFIRPGPYKLLSRERLWIPIDHENQEGRRCEGSNKRGI